MQTMQSILQSLEASLVAGTLVDPVVADAARRARDDLSVPQDAPVVVLFRGPASSESMTVLDRIVEARFGTTVPAELRAFLSIHDGMWVDVLYGRTRPSSVEAALSGKGPGERIFSIGELLIELEGMTELELPPECTRRYLPFFRVPNQGWHAFDFERGCAVVALYLDDVESPTPIAATLSEWLAGWRDHGFDAFWHEAR